MIIGQFAFGFVFVVTLMALGAWLERTGGMDGIMDELLTPLPLGIAGMLVLAERAFA